MNSLTQFGAGYRTYIIAAVMIILVIVEKGLGVDIPGYEVADDWLQQVLAALGLFTLRAGVENSKKDDAGKGKAPAN